MKARKHFAGWARTAPGVELVSGTTLEEAERFAEGLQRKVISLAPTRCGTELPGGNWFKRRTGA